MYDHTRHEMVDALIAAGVVSPEDKPKADEALKGYWEDKIAIIWTRDDIISYAEQYDITLDDEAADEVLDDLFHNHDCNYGITWDTIGPRVDDDRLKEESLVRRTSFEELPTIMNDLTTTEAQDLLKKRLKEGK